MNNKVPQHDQVFIGAVGEGEGENDEVVSMCLPAHHIPHLRELLQRRMVTADNSLVELYAVMRKLSVSWLYFIRE